jgi:arginyl-tRNA synthetase
MKATLKRLIADALERARAAGDLELAELPGLADIHVEVPREEGRGDLASNAAMTLARSARRPPRAIADAILRNLHDPAGLIASAEVAGAGFLNFTFSPAAWRQRLLEIVTQGDRYGSSEAKKGSSIQVEFVSANPTGPLHIGHGRGAATGDALARILEAVAGRSHASTTSTTPAARWRRSAARCWRATAQLFGIREPFPDDGYPGDYVIEIAEAIRARDGDRWLHADPGEAAAELARFGGERMLARIGEDLAAFGIRFDVFTSERAMRDSGEVASAIEELRRKGHVYTQDGALWFRSTASATTRTARSSRATASSRISPATSRTTARSCCAASRFSSTYGARTITAT